MPYSFTKNIFFILYVLAVSQTSFAQEKAIGAIGFYNLENLFDTENDSLINDEQYLPEGDYNWTKEKYQSKITNMAKVIADMAYGVDILGVSEIENRKVLEDLVSAPSLKGKNYQIIHFDSPDYRGVDVALLYRRGRFKPFAINRIPFNDPKNSNFRTRDILWVKGLYHGDTLHIAVNHWPSRRGGKEDKRLMAASFLRNAIDSVTNIYPHAKIILMGDFNDNPNDKSLKKVLNSTSKQKFEDEYVLFNASGATFKRGYGTLYYRGIWSLFDQIIISQSLLNDKAENYHYMDDSFSVFSPPYIKVQKGENKGAPLRTHSRGVYLNGFSDHFPTYILLGKK